MPNVVSMLFSRLQQIHDFCQPLTQQHHSSSLSCFTHSNAVPSFIYIVVLSISLHFNFLSLSSLFFSFSLQVPHGWSYTPGWKAQKKLLLVSFSHVVIKIRFWLMRDARFISSLFLALAVWSLACQIECMVASSEMSTLLNWIMTNHRAQICHMIHIFTARGWLYTFLNAC